MKTLNLDVKLLESREDLDNLQRGDVIQVYLRYKKDIAEIYYQGLAIYSGKNDGYLNFIELEFPSDTSDAFSVLSHQLGRGSIEIIHNSVFNISWNNINRAELFPIKDKTYISEKNLLLEVLRKGGFK